jgi:hypothetical protein
MALFNLGFNSLLLCKPCQSNLTIMSYIRGPEHPNYIILLELVDQENRQEYFIYRSLLR